MYNGKKLILKLKMAEQNEKKNGTENPTPTPQG